MLSITRADVFLAGDMSLILAVKGTKMGAYGIHGLTAALMILAPTP